ncbi:pyruvate synthase subunit beta [Candidatus Bathyarchaeota archaeon A05DMB-3]|nr:pyruvate synthase subunit beta [Candidatus Bathyarchaeota archaeon A05DMB-3]PMB74182.1 MAG: 2-ketoisovalerate ferredoxin oxidoreductase [Candidatus Bathyarchaeota archaeon]
MKELPREEYLLKGHAACAGCGPSIALRLLFKALGNKVFLVVPACCTTVIQGPYPYTSFAVPLQNMLFEATGATASGIAAALRIRGLEDITVVGWAGDGGTVDIGIQALSGAAERETNFIYICYDNEAYGNTGLQRSGATPYGAWTTTTPTGKKERKKNMPFIMAAHKIPYVATACPSYPTDFVNKLRKAKEIKGTKYIHVLAPCPTGWRYDSSKTVEIGRLAVQTGIWALYEIENGKFRLNFPSDRLVDKAKRKPIKEYLSMQERFRHLTEAEIEKIQMWIDEDWEYYRKLASSEACV